MSADAETDVRNLEQQRWRAIIDKDVEALRELIADELSYTHSNAMVDTKETYLRAIEDRVFDYQGVRHFDDQCRVIGDVALLTGRAEIDVVAGGSLRHLDARYSVVWVRRDGRWHFLCWQSTALPG
jgi:ketosteroid isomerase-like protein